MFIVYDLHGSSSELVDLDPDARTRDQSVTRECEDCSSTCLGSSKADELQDDDGADSVEDTAALAKRVVKDLGNRLGCR